MTVLLLLACSDYTVHTPDPPDPADVPGVDPDRDVGAPPDWNTCEGGWHGVYANLADDHPDVEPPEDEPARADPRALDWWDAVAYREYDGSLDLGEDWWPVDEGWASDPAYFAVRWTAWVRARSDTTLTVQLGSADDAWVLLNDDVVVARPGVQAFRPETLSFPVQAGQFPLDLRFAHRAGDTDGFRFRVLGGDVTLCYPEF